jgi:LacI family transcriptional regulator
VAVPEEVSVIGVDNEILACKLARPPLSSIIPDCRRIGYEAAETLDRIIKGEQPAGQRREIPPYGIVTRQSTDVSMTPDPLLADAMHLIRGNACAGFGSRTF